MVNLRISRKEAFFLKALIESDKDQIRQLMEKAGEDAEDYLVNLQKLSSGLDDKLKEAIANSS